MKAIIMASGKGTRMLPLTQDTPKSLIPVNGHPFLYYLVNHLIEADIEDIGVIVGHLKHKFPEFVNKYNFPISLIPLREYTPSGTGATALAAKYFTRDESFILCNGDSLWSPRDISSLCIDDNLNYMSAVSVTNPSDYGVLITEKDGTLIEIIEKPQMYCGDLVNVGLYKFTSELYPHLEKLQPSPRGEYEITDAIFSLAKEGKVKVRTLEDYWLDFGRPNDIPILEKKIRIIISLILIELIICKVNYPPEQSSVA